MSVCVLDSSVTLAWVLPGEADAATAAILKDISVAGATVPALWSVEIGNVLLVAERRRRITSADRQEAVEILSDLPIQIEALTCSRVWGETLTLAARHGLTVYDACYLEAATRLRLPLATRDADLKRAAAEYGVTIVG